VKTPTRSETQVAASQSLEEKKFAYQRSDHWLGGNSKNLDAEKDIGMTISTGRIRKARIAIERAPSHNRLWLASGIIGL
jgi:hypothetical protein